MGAVGTASPYRFRVARIPEQRTSSLLSEVKTITEAGPSEGDLPESPQPGLPPEQQVLLGSGGSHTKWLKPPTENKAEVRAGDRKFSVSTWVNPDRRKAKQAVWGALDRCHFSEAQVAS